MFLKAKRKTESKLIVERKCVITIPKKTCRYTIQVPILGPKDKKTYKRSSINTEQLPLRAFLHKMVRRAH